MTYPQILITADITKGKRILLNNVDQSTILQKQLTQKADETLALVRVPSNVDAPLLVERLAGIINRSILTGDLRIKVRRRSGRPGGCSSSAEEYIRQTVEEHFLNMQKEEQLCEELIAEFAERHVQPEVSVQTSGHSDRTAGAVIQLEEACADLFAWRKVVKGTFRAFQGTTAGDIMEKRYVRSMEPLAVQKALHIAPSTFYTALKRVLHYAGLLASNYHLLDFEDDRWD